MKWTNEYYSVEEDSPTTKAKSKALRKFLDGINFDSILDIGGLDGRMFKLLFDSKGDYILAEMDHKSMKKSKKFGVKKVVKIGDLEYERLPLKKKYDLVMCLDVLEHIHNLENALNEISRLSKNYILITIPNDLTLFHRFRVVFKGKIYNHPYNLYGHCRFPSIKQTEEFIQQNFNVIKKGYNTRFHIPSFIMNALPGLFARGTMFLCKKKIIKAEAKGVM